MIDPISLEKTTAETFIEQGVRQGVQQGIQKGMQEGLQLGIRQGLQQGIRQGIRQGKQDILIHLLNQKFGLEESEKILIKKITNMENLDQAIDQILSADCKEEVLSVF